MPRTNPAQQQHRLVQQCLAAVERAVNQLVASLDGRGGSRPTTRRLKLSPKRRAALKLHGYLGRIRLLKLTQKAKVKNMKAEKGYHAAISLAKRLAK